MKRITQAFVAFFLMIGLAQAQSLELQTISTGGTDLVSSTGERMNVVIGEIATEKLSKDGKVLTQGFHQIFEISTSVSNDRKQFHLTIFPNPTADNIHMEGSTEGAEFQLTIFDLSGKIRIQYPYHGDRKELDLSDLESGQYLILVTKSGGQPVTQFKFQKI